MGIISGVTPKGIFVKLENNAEGFVSLNDFENYAFEYDGEVSHRDLRSGRVLMMGEEIGIIAVSYTHLDVYKRQEYPQRDLKVPAGSNRVCPAGCVPVLRHRV